MTLAVPLDKMAVCLEELARVSEERARAALGADDDRARALAEVEGRVREELARASAAARAVGPPAPEDAGAFRARIASSEARLRASANALEVAAGSRATVEAFGALFARQGIANLPEIARHPSAASLASAFAGRAAVLVSPGPSLDRNVHELRGLAGRVVIVAVSHALHALLRAGVTPDVVIATDSQDLRYHFDGVPLGDATLVLGATVHPDLFALPARAIVTVGANTVIDAWLYEAIEPYLEVPSGGSVATTAFSLARLWGFSSIALVGQDLAFSGGRFYAASSVDGEARVEHDERGAFVAGGSAGLDRVADGREGSRRLELVEVPGYGGGVVRTSRAFAVARQWFGDEARRVGRECALYNCTEGGARIEGMTEIPLSALGSTLPAPAPEPVAAVVARAAGALDQAARRRATAVYVKRLVAAIDAAVSGARECERLAERALARPERARRLDAPEAALQVALRGAHVLSIVTQRPLREAGERGARARSLAEALHASLDLYRAIRARAAELRGPLVTTLRRLE